MSERWACRAIHADRKSVRYRSVLDDDSAHRERLRDLANQGRRFGYRRLHIQLRREGAMINPKKTERLSMEEGLAVRRRRSRKRAVGTRAPGPVRRCRTSAGAATSSMARWLLADGSGWSMWSMT